MNMRWLPRLAIAGAAAAVLAFSAPAHATGTSIAINPGNVPTTAADFENHECSDNLGGGPYAGKDVWVFNLPGSTAAGENFTSITAKWSTSEGTVVKMIPTDGGAIVRIGTSKAYIATPAGWTLIKAYATVTGHFTSFVLTHTCPATWTSPSSSPSASASASVSPSPSMSESMSPSPSISASVSPSGSVSPSESPSTATPSTSPSGGGLPVTGAAVGGIVTTGVALLCVGAGLVFLHRRRSLMDSEE